MNYENVNLYSAKLGCYKVKETAKLPSKGTDQAACYDLYACVDEPLKLDPRERVLVPTGLILDIPRGFSARIHTRSGMQQRKRLVFLFHRELLTLIMLKRSLSLW